MCSCWISYKKLLRGKCFFTKFVRVLPILVSKFIEHCGLNHNTFLFRIRWFNVVVSSSSCLVKSNERFGYLVAGSPSLKWFEHTSCSFSRNKFSLPLLIIDIHSCLFSSFLGKRCHFIATAWLLFFYFDCVTLVIVAWENAAAIVLSHLFV